MKPQDIDTIVRLLREEARRMEISSQDYARIMMREAATTIVALASELAARDEQVRAARADAEHRQARLEIALRDMGMAISMQRLLTSTGAAAKAMAAAKAALATRKAAPAQTETQPECPMHPHDRPVAPEALDASTRAERERVLALAGQMQRDCAGLHSIMVRRLEALIEDIKCGARTYP